MRYVLIVVVLFGAVGAFAQDKHGTVVIVAVSDNKIVMAADSREMWNGQWNNDNECKIRRLKGDLIFAATGRKGHVSDGHPEFTWDSLPMAAEVAKGTIINSNRIEGVAMEWAKRVTALHNRDVGRGVVDAYSLSKEAIESAFFSGFRGGKPIVYGVDILRNPKASGPQRYTERLKELPMHDNFVRPMGEPDIVEEFIGATSERGNAWLDEFRIKYPVGTDWDAVMIPQLKRAIELSITYSVNKKDIGGPVDIVEIRPAGLRWIQKKESCPD